MLEYRKNLKYTNFYAHLSMRVAWWWYRFDRASNLQLICRGLESCLCSRHQYTVASLGKLLTFTCVSLSRNSITWYRSKGGDALTLRLGTKDDRRSGDALVMCQCHRLCGLSAYEFKAHVREISNQPKANHWAPPSLLPLLIWASFLPCINC